MEQSPLGSKVQEAIGPQEKIGFDLCFERKAQWIMSHEKRMAGSSQVSQKNERHKRLVPVEMVRCHLTRGIVRR